MTQDLAAMGLPWRRYKLLKIYLNMLLVYQLEDCEALSFIYLVHQNNMSLMFVFMVGMAMTVLWRWKLWMLCWLWQLAATTLCMEI